MIKSTLEGRIYFFACNFLGDVITMFHYLEEEFAREDIWHLRHKWSKPESDLLDWASEARWLSLDREKVERNEKDSLFSTAETVGDTLVIRLAKALHAVAVETYQKYSGVSESMWIYYYYCRFFLHVLTEFGQVVRESGSSQRYHEHYQKHIGLFNAMAAALEDERPFLNDPGNVDDVTVQAVWAEIDASVAGFGAEWHQAVLAAARDQQLSDLDNGTT